LRYAGLISSTLALAVLAGCGGGNAGETVFTPVAGTESAYATRSERGRSTNSTVARAMTSPIPPL